MDPIPSRTDGSATTSPARHQTVFRVPGRARLAGTVQVAGAKNAALKQLAGTVLAPGRHRLVGVPAITDVDAMCDALTGCGVAVTRTGSRVDVTVPAGGLVPQVGPAVAGRLRASLQLAGPLLATTGRAVLAMPGGCDLGGRGIDLHVDGFRQLGASVTVLDGNLVVTAPAGGLVGTAITLPFPSVGATENLVMAAVTATGTTRILGAAREPEVVATIRMLNAAGAQVTGAGTDVIVVEGVDRAALAAPPDPTRVIGDRIQAGTWLFAAAATGGDVTVVGVDPTHLAAEQAVLQAMGVTVHSGEGWVRAVADGPLSATDVCTGPFPAFATDLQAVATVALLAADGLSVVTDTVFPGRTALAGQLARLGGNVVVGDGQVMVGRSPLPGGRCDAPDLRAGAALVVAGLIADGPVDVVDVGHVARGYPDLVGTVNALGGSVSTVPG